MPTLARNHRQVLAAPLIGDKRTRYTIAGAPGLLLDVYPSGKRVWSFPDGRYSPAVGVDGLLILTGRHTLYGLAPA